MKKIARYRKTFAAGVAALIGTIPLVWDGISQSDAVALVTMWSGVVGVYLFPNDTPEGEAADPEISERG